MSVLAIITARKNSKGLPGKNMLDLGGKPLIAHTLDLADQIGEFDRIILSTDIDEAIDWANSKNTRIEVPFKRPAELCGDESTHAAVVHHLLKYFEQQDYYPKLLVLLQPTTPFRTKEELINGVSILKNGAESVLGVSAVIHHPADYLYQTNHGKIQFMMPEFSTKRRQEFPEIWFNNGAFYGCSTELFLQTNNFFNENSACLKMSENAIIDIDTPFDLKLAKGLIN